MPDKSHYYLSLGFAAFLGAIVSAIGNAFGFSRRVSALEKRQENCYSKTEQDKACAASCELMRVHLEHHSEAITQLSKDMKAEFKKAFLNKQ